jgi:hypothetical protein
MCFIVLDASTTRATSVILPALSGDSLADCRILRSGENRNRPPRPSTLQATMTARAQHVFQITGRQLSRVLAINTRQHA